MKRNFTVGTRKSDLAMIQTHSVVNALKQLDSDLDISVQPILTKGDKILNVSLSKIGEKGLFTQELERALEDKSFDMVVHSLKDVPTQQPESLVIGAVLKREDARDVVIMRQGIAARSLDELPSNAVVGTSSLRRAAQLRRLHPHLKLDDVRGNLNTRLRKLDEEGGKYSALVLAAAGVLRMKWDHRITDYLQPEKYLYAVGQGSLAVQCRADDADVMTMLAKLTDKSSLLQAITERSFLHRLNSGCSAPVAVRSEVKDGVMTFTGVVYSVDGQRMFSADSHMTFSTENGDEAILNNGTTVLVCCDINRLHQCDAEQAQKLGLTVADDLLRQGAGVEIQNAITQKS